MNIQCGDTYTLSFTDTSLLGAGVAHIDGMAVFCPGVIAGDTAEVRITSIDKRYANAALQRILTPSPSRIAPDCDSFGACGGCLFRHMQYSAETSLKENAVRAALRRCGAEHTLEPIVTATPECYRNKAVFHLDTNGNIGYFSQKTHTLLYPADGRCRLHPAIFDEIAAFTAAFFKQNSSGAQFHALSLRRAVSGECTALLFAETDSAAVRQSAERYFSALQNDFPAVVGGFLGIGTTAAPEKILPISGEAYLRDTFLSLELRISPAAFYQVNHTVAQRLCQTVAEYAALQPGESAADLYCGTGTIGLTLAALSPDAAVTGIEINESAVRDAIANAEQNQLHNIHFRCGDSATAERDGLRFDCIVIDPPRKGCSPEMIAALTRLSPVRIVYVSCNPATLSRDAAALAKSGWQITRARPLDMFPRTGHVECVTLLSR